MSSQSNHSYTVVAGAHAGHKVTMNPSTHAVYKNLASMAEQGNHWA